MTPNSRPAHFYQAGFSLVEIMVGLVIGLLATLVIMQVFSVFEGQKRTTTGLADAQTNGSIALYSIQRELQMAGYGLLPSGVAGDPDSAIECTVLNNAAAVGIASISPVTITDGGTAAGASDSITLRYSASDMGGIPVTIINMDVPFAPSNAFVDNNMGCQNNDIVLIVNGNTCSLTTVAGLSAVPAASGVKATITLQDPANAAAGANLACLGTWREITYRVNGGNLERQELPTLVDFVPTIANIVNIQAQYGISGTPNSNRIVQWVDATGSWDASAISVADRNRIKAIRIAIVARNGLLEKENVSFPCDSVTSNAPNGLCAWSATSLAPQNPSPAPWILLSNDADGTSWQRYRYRVFETVIPLRNMLWSKGTL